MAGSYGHIETKKGNLVSNETFVQMIENLGDAYEMTEEMFGMIWYLAATIAQGAPDSEVKRVVQVAMQRYKRGLEISRDIHRRSPGRAKDVE